MSRVAAIVQARMGSKRLPGKMMLPLAGRPLVDHVLTRLMNLLKPEGPLDSIVLATSSSPKDDALAEYVRKEWPSITVVRGPEDDVLERFVLAVTEVQAETIVRVTGDCPLVNTDGLRKMIEAHKTASADVTNYKPGFEYVDKGLEVIAASALKRASEDPEATPLDREHVTALMYRRPSRYNVHYIDSESYLRRGDIRLTVDTEADLRFLETICQGLQKSPVNIALSELVVYLDNNPELLAINAGAGRKSTLHERARLGFRCDGGSEIGLGHVVGCIRMAHLVAQGLSIGVEFVVRENTATLDMIRKAGFSVEVLPSDISPKDDIARLIEKATESDWSGVLVNFCKNDIDRYASPFGSIKDTGIKLIFMDNPVPSSYMLGDVVINALPHPDYNGYDPTLHPACYDGLAYFLLDEAYRPYIDQQRSLCLPIERILVAMGGADMPNITSLVLEGLAIAGYQGYVDVVLGAANPHKHDVESRFKALGLQGEINFFVNDMPERMWAADLSFSALGLTTYEMAFMGLPTVIIAGSTLNSIVAKAFITRYSSGLFLGSHNEVTPTAVADCLNRLSDDFEQRLELSQRQRLVVDGHGSARVLPLIQRGLDLFDSVVSDKQSGEQI